MAELLRTTFDPLGNTVSFYWDGRPTKADTTWALEQFKKGRKPGFVRDAHSWGETRKHRKTRPDGIDPRAHGYHTMSVWR